jgi:hypothetical protein
MHRSLRARPALLAAAALTLFGAGLVAACGGGAVAAGGTLSATLSRSSATTPAPTAPQETVTTTRLETVQETVTTTETATTNSHLPGAILITPTTTTDSTSSTETKTWALIVIGAAVIGLVALLIWLALRHGHKEVPAERRRQLLAGAVAAWVGQGWAPESQTDTTAVLRRGAEQMVIAVDGQGNVSSQAVGTPGPDAPPR